MKNVNCKGILTSLIVMALMGTACGRSTTVGASTSSTVYAADSTGATIASFSVNQTTGALTATTTTLPTPAAVFASATTVTVGAWTYVLDRTSNVINVFSTSNLNVIVNKIAVPTGTNYVAISAS